MTPRVHTLLHHFQAKASLLAVCSCQWPWRFSLANRRHTNTSLQNSNWYIGRGKSYPNSVTAVSYLHQLIPLVIKNTDYVLKLSPTLIRQAWFWPPCHEDLSHVIRVFRCPVSVHETLQYTRFTATSHHLFRRSVATTPVLTSIVISGPLFSRSFSCNTQPPLYKFFLSVATFYHINTTPPGDIQKWVSFLSADTRAPLPCQPQSLLPIKDTGIWNEQTDMRFVLAICAGKWA